MAAGIRKMSVMESKHSNSTNFNYRSTGVVCLNDIIKEHNTFRTRTPRSAVREPLSNEVSEVTTSLFELDLGEEEELFVGSEEKSLAVKKLEALLEPLTNLEKQVSNDVKYLVLRHSNHSRFGHLSETAIDDYDQSILATDLQALGYDVKVRRSIGGGAGTEGVTNLNHTFLRCTPPGSHHPPSERVRKCDLDSDHVFIVDVNFREQFDIAHKTASYERVLEFVPKLLVLREDRLAPVVRGLSQELAESFHETGFPLPPWRKVDSLLSKWLPRKSMDTPLLKPVQKEGVVPKTGQSLPPFNGNGLTGPLRVR